MHLTRPLPRLTGTRPAGALLAVALLTALTACGGSSGGGTGGAQQGDGPVATGLMPGATLVAEVGTADQPDAYEISLHDAAGATVATVPAGAYTIKVTDHSSIHNFVLSGTGVSQTTTVSGRGTTTWQVVFTAGKYTYVCDPHPSMNGALTVT